MRIELFRVRHFISQLPLPWVRGQIVRRGDDQMVRERERERGEKEREKRWGQRWEMRARMRESDVLGFEECKIKKKEPQSRLSELESAREAFPIRCTT